MDLITEYIRSNAETVLRLLLAMILGGLIGAERGKMNRPAGIRTHMIVCIGACLIMLIDIYRSTINPENDANRLAAQVVSGIGFLGAGAILKDGFSVTGLTTAATLWVVGCVGLAVGSGFYLGAVITTAIVYVSLQYIGNSTLIASKRKITLYVNEIDVILPQILSKLESENIRTNNVSVRDPIDGKSYKTIVIDAEIEHPSIVNRISSDLLNINGVIFVHIE